MLTTIRNNDERDGLIEEAAGGIIARLPNVVVSEVVTILFGFQNDEWIPARQVKAVVAAGLTGCQFDRVLRLIIEGLGGGKFIIGSQKRKNELVGRVLL